MGLNLQSCCHKCKERVFHFRGKENETMIPFYRAHEWCMERDSKSVETLEDQHQEANWMHDSGGYKCIN